jgi:hypothetical protein
MKWKRWRNLTRTFPGLDMRGIEFVTVRKGEPIPPGGRPITDKDGRRAVVHPMEDAGRRGLVVRYVPEPAPPAPEDPS